jgi:hypothetical protein
MRSIIFSSGNGGDELDEEVGADGRAERELPPTQSTRIPPV